MLDGGLSPSQVVWGVAATACTSCGGPVSIWAAALCQIPRPRLLRMGLARGSGVLSTSQEAVFIFVRWLIPLT